MYEWVGSIRSPGCIMRHVCTYSYVLNLQGGQRLMNCWLVAVVLLSRKGYILD